MTEHGSDKERRLMQLLRDLERLLRSVGDERKADRVKNVLDALVANPSWAVRELVGNTFWGGAGSFMDYGPVCSRTGVDASAAKQAYWRAMLSLLRALREQGYEHPWFDQHEAWLTRATNG